MSSSRAKGLKRDIPLFFLTQYSSKSFSTGFRVNFIKDARSAKRQNSLMCLLHLLTCVSFSVKHTGEKEGVTLCFTLYGISYLHLELN